MKLAQRVLRLLIALLALMLLAPASAQAKRFAVKRPFVGKRIRGPARARIIVRTPRVLKTRSRQARQRLAPRRPIKMRSPSANGASLSPRGAITPRPLKVRGGGQINFDSAGPSSRP